MALYKIMNPIIIIYFLFCNSYFFFLYITQFKLRSGVHPFSFTEVFNGALRTITLMREITLDSIYKQRVGTYRVNALTGGPHITCKEEKPFCKNTFYNINICDTFPVGTFQ